MRKSIRVFRRDVGRIARARRTWVIVLGVLVTPALYAWFNINAFWDPYAETGNITVAVVNLDEGATSDLTGSVDVGAEVIDQLRQDDQLAWSFMDEAEARSAVESGDAYAAIIIPADFSSDLLSITTPTFTQPALSYLVNEKVSAIAPKITDAGAAGLDEQITSAFTDTVAESVTAALRDAGVDIEDRLDSAQASTLSAFDDATETISSARTSLTDLTGQVADAQGAVGSARGSLADVDRALGDAQNTIAQAQELIAQTQVELLAFTDTATSAYVQATTALAGASAQANGSVTRITEAIDQANGTVGAAIADIEATVAANGEAIAQLQSIVDGSGLDPALTAQLTQAIEALQERNAADQALLADLANLNDSNASAVQSVQDAADALDAAVRGAQTGAEQLRSSLAQSVPAVNAAMSELSRSTGAFSGALGAQRAQLVEADNLLVGVGTQLGATGDALTSLEGDLANIEAGIGSARSDVAALGAASSFNTIQTLTGLDPQQIAAFVASPVEVDETAVFPVSTYGSAMSALFTNLSLWIGAFVLMVIFKIEVDTEDVEPITVSEAYVGRFLLLGTLAIGQALIVSVGNLIIGVQVVNVAAYVGTTVLIALAYVSIIYALCVSFGHVGRGLCVLLVIMQIPGASGLYPIEMMPSFFRSLYPFLPFTYGIDAMRETIAGFYGNHYWRFMGALAIFVVLSWILGLVLRRRLAGLNVVFNREIAATDLLIGENVQVTGNGYRLTDIIHALSNRDEYRDDLRHRSRLVTTHYRGLLLATVLVGVAGTLVIAIAVSLRPSLSVVGLFVWVLWTLAVIAFLVTIEYIRQSFQLADEVAHLDDATLRREMIAHGPHRARVLANGDDDPPSRRANTDGGADA